MARPRNGVIAAGALPHSTSGEHDDLDTLHSGIGNALLAAVGASLTGARAAICAVIDPGASTDLLQASAGAGIDVSRVRTASRDRVAQADYEPGPDQLASVGPGAGVHLCPMSLKSQRRLVRAVWQRVALVTVDASYPPNGSLPSQEQFLELAVQCDAVLLGRPQLEAMWPGKNPRQVLRLCHRHGVRAAVIKMGNGHAIGIADDVVTWIPSFPLTKPLTSLSDDVYGGAFCAAFAKTGDLSRAMALASAAVSAVAESRLPLELLNDFARASVETRARYLETTALQG